MKAMIFAAGFGTRLKPLTDTCPKALVKVGEHTIEHLKQHGFDEIIINVHYLGNQIIDFINQHTSFGIRIEISDETDRILETGGGLLNAQHFFNDGQPFLVCNADVFTNINLTKFYQSHLAQNAIASLAVRNRKSSRVLLFDAHNPIFADKKYNIIKQAKQAAFSGYQILSPQIFKHKTRDGIFSMTDWYIDICFQQTIYGYHHDEDIWIDIGSPEQLQKANEVCAQQK